MSQFSNLLSNLNFNILSCFQFVSLEKKDKIKLELIILQALKGNAVG